MKLAESTVNSDCSCPFIWALPTKSGVLYYPNIVICININCTMYFQVHFKESKLSLNLLLHKPAGPHPSDFRAQIKIRKVKDVFWLTSSFQFLFSGTFSQVWQEWLRQIMTVYLKFSSYICLHPIVWSPGIWLLWMISRVLKWLEFNQYEPRCYTQAEVCVSQLLKPTFHLKKKLCSWGWVLTLLFAPNTLLIL